MRRKRLTLEEKVGQLFWVGFQGTSLIPYLRDLLEHVRPGGVILFGRNIETAVQVRALTDGVYGAVSIPPFIALDQEGGRVNRLKPILGTMAANLALAGRSDAVRAIDRQATALARALRNLGFNVNLAPVLDL